MLKKFLAVISLVIVSSAGAETWFHFDKTSSYYDSYYQLKAMGYTPRAQLSNPLRISVWENLTEIQRKEAKALKNIVEANSSSTQLYEQSFYSPWGVQEAEKAKYTKYVWGGAGLITFVHGASVWRWINERARFGFESEKWFSSESYSGGADKVGHMFSMYFQKRGLNWFFLNIGHDFESANLHSALLTEVLGILVEVGDGLTHYHFSYEDVVMNTVGIIFGYFADKHPWLDELIGLKWEYFPSHDLLHGDDLGKSNFTSDYSGQKFWLSFKGTGIPAINHTLLRYMSIDLGYFTRGYIPDIDNSKWKNPYRAYAVGVGINLSELVFKVNPKSTAVRGTSRFLKYWVPPGTVIPAYEGRL